MRIARRREAVWVIAGLLLAYTACMHLLFNWSRYRWWYNLGVVIPVMFAVWLGARPAYRAPPVEAT